MAKKPAKAAKKSVKQSKKQVKTGGAKRGVTGIGGEGKALMQGGRGARKMAAKAGKHHHHHHHSYSQQQHMYDAQKELEREHQARLEEEAWLNRDQKSAADSAKATRSSSKKSSSGKGGKAVKKQPEAAEDEGRPPSGLPAEEKLEILLYFWKNLFWN